MQNQEQMNGQDDPMRVRVQTVSRLQIFMRDCMGMDDDALTLRMARKLYKSNPVLVATLMAYCHDITIAAQQMAPGLDFKGVSVGIAINKTDKMIVLKTQIADEKHVIASLPRQTAEKLEEALTGSLDTLFPERIKTPPKLIIGG